MAMSQSDLNKVKELFATIGRTGALDFQKRAAANVRKLAKAANRKMSQDPYTVFMIAADEIERMKAVESSK